MYFERVSRKGRKDGVKKEWSKETVSPSIYKEVLGEADR